MAIFDLFGFKPIDDFVRSTITQFANEIPPSYFVDSNLTGKKKHANLPQTLNKLFSEINEFAKDKKLGLVKRARLSKSVQDNLYKLGYPADFNDDIAIGVAKALGKREVLGFFESALKNNEENTKLFSSANAKLLGSKKPGKAKFQYKVTAANFEQLVEKSVNLTNAKKTSEAFPLLEQLIRFNPNNAVVIATNAVALALEEKWEDALADFNKAIDLDPNHVQAHVNRATTFLMLEKPREAKKDLEQALRIDPQKRDAHINMGNTMVLLGKADEAIASYQRGLVTAPEEAQAYAHSNMLLNLQYSIKYSPDEIFAEHLRFAEYYEKPHKKDWPHHSNTPDKDRRLRIGYVSADFRDHSVAFFIETVLANHDASKVEVFGYYNDSRTDHITERLINLFDHWCQCNLMSDDELAKRIRHDKIDILVDLSGHTGGNRLLTFARKPAPIQISWIGYPSSTGLSAMDYRLTDKWGDPPKLAEGFHTEKLVYHDFGSTFRPLENSPPVNELPAQKSKVFTFACLNNPVKYNERVFAVWARILHAVPDSRLILGNMDDDEIKQSIIGSFTKLGINENRIVMHPRMSIADFQRLHHQIDLALDPFPYTGGTTTFHSLWMGVPVISLSGRTSVSRCGASILMQAGLPEFVVYTEEDYVQLAIKMAGDKKNLNKIRQGLRKKPPGAIAGDFEKLAPRLEAIFRDLWHKWCDEQKNAIVTTKSKQKRSRNR